MVCRATNVVHTTNANPSSGTRGSWKVFAMRSMSGAAEAAERSRSRRAAGRAPRERAVPRPLRPVCSNHNSRLDNESYMRSPKDTSACICTGRRLNIYDVNDMGLRVRVYTPRLAGGGAWRLPTGKASALDTAPPLAADPAPLPRRGNRTGAEKPGRRTVRSH